MAYQIFNHLPNQDINIPKDIKIFFMLQGYVTWKHCPREEEVFNDAAFYFQMY